MKLYAKLLVVFSALALGACSSSSNNDANVFPLPATGIIEVIHAVADAPTVNVLVNGEVALAGVDYGQASGSVVFELGTYNVSVEAILPGGATVEVIPPTAITVTEDTVTTVIAAGSAAAGTIAPIPPFVNPRANATAGTAKVFVIHGVDADLPVQVFATAPGADLAAEAPLDTINFGGFIGPAELAAGDYQIRILDTMDNQLFDSGTITLSDGDDLRLIATPNVSGGPAAITLLAVSGSGASEILDVNVPTNLRIGHLSQDAGPVDVLVNDAEYLTDIPFPVIEPDFAALPADTYNVAVTPADMPMNAVIGPVDLDLAAGTFYTVLAIDTLANIEPLILTDDPRPVATAAKLRVVHAAAGAPAVDVYLTAPGVGIAEADPVPELTGVAFKGASPYLFVPAGTYDVTVAVGGTKDVAIGPAEVTVANGGSYTAIARDPDLVAMEMNFGLEVLVDSAPIND